MIEVLEEAVVGTKYIRLIKWFQGRLRDYEVEIYEDNRLIFSKEFAGKKEAKKVFEEKLQEIQFNLSQISFAI